MNLPDFDKAFEYENNFYLTCEITRLNKVLAHYELFKMTSDIPGDIIECGVFKGVSLIRFAIYRYLFENEFLRKIVGFDVFGEFPGTKYKEDLKYIKNFIARAGSQSISIEQLYRVFIKKGIHNFELIKGDVTNTIPKYIKENPHLKISLLNLDTDFYEPAETILKCLFPRISKGGILILDNYGIQPGETRAADDYFKDKNIRIKKLLFTNAPSYVVI